MRQWASEVSPASGRPHPPLSLPGHVESVDRISAGSWSECDWPPLVAQTDLKFSTVWLSSSSLGFGSDPKHDSVERVVPEEAVFAPECRFVVLDGYDVSVLGWPPGHPHAEKAEEILRTRNPNMEKNSPEGLVGVARRFVKFGGGVGEGQLAWLDATLKAAGAAGERVVVGCHLPLDPEAAAHPACLLWNFEEVMEVVHSHRCVVACLSGHVHQRGHSRDCRGVHHVVLEAALECPPTTSAFGRIDVYPDRLSLIGTDRMASKELAIETYQRP